MTKFVKRGNLFSIHNNQALEVEDFLPANNYAIKATPEGLFLETIDNFVRPSKIYGNAIRHTERIINTFLNRPQQTGIMMTGEKGSGKTLLVKNVSIELAEQGIPTIVINQPFTGEAFNTLIQSIQQPCAILFDEFEKVYDDEDQQSILTLLDGVFNSKKLFMFTCNDKWRVNGFMRNRPGRIFYMLDFTGLDDQFIIEYCNDNLNNKNHISKVCAISRLFTQFNFDMLKAMVEEMNRYDETPAQAMTMLNINPEFDEGGEYAITVFKKDNTPVAKVLTEVFRGNPLKPNGFDVYYTLDKRKRNDNTVELNTNSLVNCTADGEYVFEDNGVKIILTRIRRPTSYRVDYDAY